MENIIQVEGRPNLYESVRCYYYCKPLNGFDFRYKIMDDVLSEKDSFVILPKPLILLIWGWCSNESQK